MSSTERTIQRRILAGAAHNLSGEKLRERLRTIRKNKRRAAQARARAHR